ncbi:MAG: hypothetical protein AB7K24_11585, partial [Gemmataceae bacterium]
SGSNVFDPDGSLTRAVNEMLRQDPAASYESVHERLLARHEDRIRMNQMSPRIFEAIALRTALVLFEGEYSGVVEPEKHYIPLKHDFSNASEVLDRLEDVRYLEELTERAFADVIAPGRYGYGRLGQLLDRAIDEQCERPAFGYRFNAALIGRATSLEHRSFSELPMVFSTTWMDRVEFKHLIQREATANVADKLSQATSTIAALQRQCADLDMSREIAFQNVVSLQTEVKALKSSFTWRVGRVVTGPLRAFKTFVQRRTRQQREELEAPTGTAASPAGLCL